MSLRACIGDAVEYVGSDMTLTRDGGSYSTATRSVTASTTAYSIVAAWHKNKTRLVDDGMAQVNDRALAVKAEGLSVVPLVNDLITYGTEKYKVLHVEPKVIEAVTVAYDLHVRGNPA